MNEPSRRLPTLIVMVAVLWATGCDYEASRQGERGNLEFTFTAADGSTEFDRPIAVDSTLTMRVDPLDGRSFDEVTEVSAAPEEVMKAVVDAEQDNAFQLHARAPGSADVSVRVRDNNDTYGDETLVRTDDIDSIEMGHRCTDGADAAYLTDTRFRVDWTRRNPADQTLVGTTRNSGQQRPGCRAEIFPSDFQTSPRCDSAGMHFPPVDELLSIDLFALEELDTPAADNLQIHIIDPDEMLFDPPEESLVVDQRRTVELHPVWNPDTGGWSPVCTPLELMIEIYNPQTCLGPSNQEEFTVDPGDDNEFDLLGLEPGICHLDIRLADWPHLDPWPVEIEVQ